MRVGKKRGKTMKRYKVLSGRIKESYKDDTYLVRFRLSDSRLFSIKRFQVEDISDFKRKRSVKKGSEKRKKYQKSLRIVKTRSDRLDQIISRGFSISYDPPGDGSCQFSALSFSLLILGFYRSPKSLRRDVVNSLRDNRFLNGMPLEDFKAHPLDEYLDEMAKDGMYGDEITLRYIANLFNVEFTII